jgi:uncharacterized protein YneF (UPF0154 family)
MMQVNWDLLTAAIILVLGAGCLTGLVFFLARREVRRRLQRRPGEQ